MINQLKFLIFSADAPGSSSNQCDETYTGPTAFSEPETKSLADYIVANEGYIKMFLSFHSYSQLLLYPFSYTNEDAKDAEMLQEMMDITAEGIKSVHGTEYIAHPSYHLCKFFKKVFLFFIYLMQNILSFPN